jgi:hypothetical protein
MPEDLIYSLSQNEPLNWLFGRVLPKLAARGEKHFLFEILAGGHEHTREWWNAIIREFRSVLVNPELAAKKCDDELGTSEVDRIADFMSEVFAVIYLSRSGYSDFAAILAEGKRPAADFTALKDGRRVRIEVKHLREPQETINAVVSKRWTFKAVDLGLEIFIFPSPPEHDLRFQDKSFLNPKAHPQFSVDDKSCS